MESEAWVLSINVTLTSSRILYDGHPAKNDFEEIVVYNFLYYH